MKRISATLPGRVLALLLTLCLLFTAGAVTAFADANEDYPYLYPEEQNYDELSFYVFHLTEEDAEAQEPVNQVAGTYRLIDDNNGSKVAYCADAVTYDNPGFRYRQIPLSQKFDEDAIKHLRAIINHSYPFITVEDMVEEMQGDNVALNSATIPYYQMVLISAVQQAIYTHTNEGYDQIYNRFGGVLPYIKYNLFRSMIYQYKDYSEEEGSIINASDNIKADVYAVFGWLIGLPGEEDPAETVTVDVQFKALIDTVEDNYKLTLYELSEDVKNGVDLSVTVKSGNNTAYTGPVTVSNDKIEVDITSSEIAPGNDVTVELSVGKQYQDVVAYESEERPDAPDPTMRQSQLFIGQGTLVKTATRQQTVNIPAKVEVPVEKVWVDNNNKEGIRPASVTVHLYANDKDTGKTLKLNETIGWKGTFENLDATVGGVPISYTVKEDPVTGYDSEVTSTGDGFTITNTSRGAISIRPADITIYMGGEEGYDAVVGSGSDLLDKNNSLPSPLFHITAPEGVKPEYLTFISSELIPGTNTPKAWTVSVAGETREHVTLYYLETVNAGQDDVRIQYTKDDGSAITSDQFDPNEVEDLYLDYTAKLYTGTVDVSGVRAVDKTNDKDYGLCLGEGTLRVRAVEDGSGTPDTNPVYPVQNEEPATKLSANTAAVVAEQDTKYRLNYTTVEVEAKGVGLLFDDIYDKDNGQDQREKTLIECSDKVIGPAASNVTRYHQAKYLDLVDQNNGNAWVKTVNEPVKVVWAYPEGTDKSTSFTLLHFAGLHRDDADDASSGYETTDIQAVKPETMTITKTDAGITFEVSSGGFSPFVLIWEKAKPAPEKEEESTTPAATPKPTPAPAKEAEPAAAPAVTTVAIPQTGDDSQPLVWVALVVLSGAALAGLAVYRKKRSDK